MMEDKAFMEFMECPVMSGNGQAACSKYTLTLPAMDVKTRGRRAAALCAAVHGISLEAREAFIHTRASKWIPVILADMSVSGAR
jgi:hypothetical protein